MQQLGSKGRRSRRSAAIMDDIALDRVGLSYCSKLLMQEMPNPHEGLSNQKKLLGYIIHYPRCPVLPSFQSRSPGIIVQADSYWAGNAATGKSTSGGVILRGSHFLPPMSSKWRRFPREMRDQMYALRGCRSASGHSSIPRNRGFVALLPCK